MQSPLSSFSPAPHLKQHDISETKVVANYKGGACELLLVYLHDTFEILEEARNPDVAELFDVRLASVRLGKVRLGLVGPNMKAEAALSDEVECALSNVGGPKLQFVSLGAQTKLSAEVLANCCGLREHEVVGLPVNERGREHRVEVLFVIKRPSNFLHDFTEALLVRVQSDVVPVDTFERGYETEGFVFFCLF
jgi:hypothetical protein